MAKKQKLTEENINKAIELLDQGKMYKEIAEEIGVNPDYLSMNLRSLGYSKKTYKDMLNENDIEIIGNLYINNNWDEIYKLYPFLNKQRVYTIMSNNKIKKDSYFWSEDETQFLIDNYNILSLDELEEYYNGRHTYKAIGKKAMTLGLTISQSWSTEEDNILKEYYSLLPKEEFMKLLPSRSYDAIVCHARKFGVKSYQYLNEKYTDEERQIIADNYGKLSDQQIADMIGKTSYGVRDQKYRLGLLYCNKDYTGYENISKILRGQLWDWKMQSIKSCDCKCVLTGSKNFEIHHLIGFSTIFYLTMEQLNNEDKLKGDKIEDYSKEELDYIINLFLKIHSTYPLGVCVRIDIHMLFHKLYGSGCNTEAQWNNFVERYNNHEFEDKYYN